AAASGALPPDPAARTWDFWWPHGSPRFGPLQPRSVAAIPHDGLRTGVWDVGTSGWTRGGCLAGLAVLVLAIVGCTPTTSGAAAANPTQIAFPATAVGGHAATTFRV